DGPIERFVAFTDLHAFLAVPAVPAPERPRVLFAGVLEPYKGVDVLLDAWRGVISERPDAELLIAGTGTHAGELRAAAKTPGPPRWVRTQARGSEASMWRTTSNAASPVSRSGSRDDVPCVRHAADRPGGPRARVRLRVDRRARRGVRPPRRHRERGSLHACV